MHKRISVVKEWFIAHNEVDVFHYGSNEPNTVIETGQPFLEIFETEESYINRLNELNITLEEDASN